MLVSATWAHALKTPFPSVWFSDFLNTDIRKWRITLLHRAHNHSTPKNYSKNGWVKRTVSIHSISLLCISDVKTQAGMWNPYSIHVWWLHGKYACAIHIYMQMPANPSTRNFIFITLHIRALPQSCQWDEDQWKQLSSFWEGIPLAPVPCLKTMLGSLYWKRCEDTPMHENRVEASAQPAHFSFQNSSL